MDLDPAFADDHAAALAAIEGMSVIEMIAELLVAAARYFERRLGGQGTLRRLASTAAAFAACMIVLLVKRRATAIWTETASAGNQLSGHLAHPPSAWAAP